MGRVAERSDLDARGVDAGADAQRLRRAGVVGARRLEGRVAQQDRPLPGDPIASLAGLAVRDAAQVRAEQRARRAQHALAVGERHAADQLGAGGSSAAARHRDRGYRRPAIHWPRARTISSAP